MQGVRYFYLDQVTHGGRPLLVLSRKIGEKILVGDDIVITIVRIGPNTVRVGINAPGHLNIVRDELVAASTIEPQSGENHGD